jgi:hypothetical protein
MMAMRRKRRKMAAPKIMNLLPGLSTLWALNICSRLLESFHVPKFPIFSTVKIIVLQKMKEQILACHQQ